MRYRPPLKGPYPMKQHPLWRSWYGIKDRCGNPNHPQYADYGGRGISVCQRWKDSFWDFVADIGERPEGHSIDRINNDGNYEPGNCRWATPKQQLANQRQRKSSRLIEFAGQIKPLCKWALEIGISQAALGMRLSHGWGIELALTTPYCRGPGRNVRSRTLITGRK